MKEITCLYDSYIKDFKCKYYITKSSKHFVDVGDKINIYGVKIDKINKKGHVISTACVSDVGINEKDVRTFITTLKNGKVTPVTLKDIISDNI